MVRMARSDWFLIGERILVDVGSGGLTVEELTHRAGVTKGSFYHHFGSRDGFVSAFLDHLESRAFADVVAGVDRDAEPQVRVRQLVEEIARLDPTLEIAVRRWAAGSPVVELLVRRVDQERLDFVEALLREAVGDPGTARRLARLHLSLYLGTLMMNPPVQGAEYLDMIDSLNVLLDR
jgi:AcrR family transcriptional regulator